MSSPTQLDNDGGKRGIDAAKVVETLGPFGLHKLFACIALGLEHQREHFARHPETAEYASTLDSVLEDVEALAHLFGDERERDGISPWQRVEDVVELSPKALEFVRSVKDAKTIGFIKGWSITSLSKWPGGSRRIANEIRDKLLAKGVRLYNARK